MIKDVLINNPMSSSKGRWNAVPTRLIPAELSRSGDVGDSVLYHSLFELASPQQILRCICSRCRFFVQVKRTRFLEELWAGNRRTAGTLPKTPFFRKYYNR
jgi:hypothetical protein